MAIASEPTVSGPRPLKSQTTYFPGLDGLRFIAFLMVFVHHIPGLSPETRPPLGVSAHDLIWLARYTIWQMGAYGVPLFFTLSSFLITRLLLVELDTFGSIRMRDFYVRRVLRIWPLYFLILAIVTLIQVRIAGELDVVALGGWLLFYGNWVLIRHASYYSILWSISVEEQFYLATSFVFLLPALVRDRRNLAILASLAITLSFAFRLAVVAYQGNWRDLWYASVAHLDCFGMGALIAIWSCNREQSPLRFPKLPTAALSALLTLAVVSFVGRLFDREHRVEMLGAGLQVFIPLAFSAVILSIIQSDGKAFLTRPTMIYLGRISYGLYLFHEMILTYIGSIEPKMPAGIRLFLPILGLAATITLASLSYRFLELPFLRLKKRFTRVLSRADVLS